MKAEALRTSQPSTTATAPGGLAVPPGFFHTLKFQVSAALLSLLLLFAGSIGYIFHTVEQRRLDSLVLNLAGKLRLTAQLMASQGQNYLENPPRDYPTYHRDVRLYYRDLMAHVAVFDRVTDAFMKQDFPPEITGLSDHVQPMMNHDAGMAVQRLDGVWQAFRVQLMEQLGPDVDEPRLEWAAKYVVENRALLQAATENLEEAYQRLVAQHVEQITAISRVVLIVALLMAIAVMVWLYAHVLRPLTRAVDGFRQVAQGDFGHQVTITANNEIGWLTEAFNRLSIRLHAIFRLMDRVQSGSDVDSTLCFVNEEFSTFLPIDWVGWLLLTGDGSALRLERAFAEGRPEVGERRHYPAGGGVVERTMNTGEPQRVTDLRETGGSGPSEFLELLADKGMRCAIFLPLPDQTAMPSLLVFATREADAYGAEQLELLNNIARLVTHSFGKTVKLAERAHLAAIGEFASGIAHEVRNPLATISLALDYFKRADLPSPAHKRAALAAEEAERMARLLEEVLLYAKPLTLGLKPIELNQALADFLESNASLAQARGLSMKLARSGTPAHVMGDRDRLMQVFLNLLRNACEAAPGDSTIEWRLEPNPAAHTVSVQVHNLGDPVPEEALARITEPFFTTKPQGTGLGLSIVQRIVDAHGGELAVSSDRESGTTVTVSLPAAG